MEGIMQYQLFSVGHFEFKYNPTGATLGITSYILYLSG